jgi:hypothetical protein
VALAFTFSPTLHLQTFIILAFLTPCAAACNTQSNTLDHSLPVWHLMGDYLSARLIKTAELDPQGRYLFAAYPHGISAISGWVCFATEAAGFSKLFPGEGWQQQQQL